MACHRGVNNAYFIACLFFFLFKSELHHANVCHSFYFEGGQTEVSDSKTGQQTRGRSGNSVSHVTYQLSKTPFKFAVYKHETAVPSSSLQH